MKKLLIITAECKNYVPVEIEKAAKAAGIEAEIIDVTKCVLIEGLKGDSPESHKLISAVYKICDDGNLEEIKVNSDTVIIPRLNEYHLEIKLGILKRFEKLGATLVNTAESMALCNDKLMTQIILNSAGIKTPYSFLVQNLDQIEVVVKHLEAQEKIKYPIIVKTLRGTHGIGVMKLDSRASLVSVGQTLSKECLDFMIQEFCPHEQSVRIIMIGDQLLASNLRGQPKDKDEFRTNSHLGSETVKYEPSEEEMATAKRIVELFGCNFCAIDYILIDKNGKKEIMVLEVNGSPGLEAIQKNWPDKNLPASIVNYVCGVSHDNVTVPVTSTPLEVHTAMEASSKQKSIDSNSLSDVEPCIIHRIINDQSYARIDTGAKTCSLHATNIKVDGDFVKFTRGDITYKVPLKRMAKIKNLHGGESSARPVIQLDLTVKNKRLNGVEFNLNDRSYMRNEILLGRNAIRELGFPVIVMKNPYSSFYTSPYNNPNSNPDNTDNDDETESDEMESEISVEEE